MQPLSRPNSLSWAVALACSLLVGCGSYSFLGDSRPYTGTMSSTTVHNGQVHRIVAWGEDGHGYRFEWKGDSAPELSADDREILPLDEGELIFAEYEGADDLRRVELRAGSDPAYIVDGGARAYQPDGARWVAEVIPVLIDRLGFGAETRVPRILESSRVGGVLADIERRRSDLAMSAYYEVLLESPQLTAGEVTRVVEHAAKRMDSDAHLSDLLEDALEARSGDQPVMLAVIEASRSLDSDAHLSDVLETAVDEGRAEGAVLVALLDVARDELQSDAHLADLLEEVADSADLSGPILTPYLAALSNIDSDAHASDILEELVSDKGLADGEVARVLFEAVPEIRSDAHLADVLEEVQPGRLEDPAVLAAFVGAVDGISSDAHAADVLEDQLGSAREPRVVAALLHAAADGIASDAHVADVLENCRASSVQDPSVADALRAAYDTINSRAHREDVRERFPDVTFDD